MREKNHSGTRFMSIATAIALATSILGGCGGAEVAPEPVDPELVMLSGALGNDLLVAGEPASVTTQLQVTTRGLEGATRPPINLALVVDTSGSMDGDPIVNARQASLELLQSLGPQDHLAVVAFHSETVVLLESTLLERANIGELREQIGAMEARGTTDLAGGLSAGLEQLMQNHDPEGINRLVLLSDGVPNDETQVLPLAQAAGERGIPITALGLGLDFNETLLANVASRSGGRFHYVEESSMVTAVFRDEVLRFERLLARNLRLELSPGPGVRIEGVVGQEITPMANGHVQVFLGELSEGERRDVIVRMRADPRRDGAAVELLDAVLRFDDAVQNAGPLERRAYFGARASSDEDAIAAGRNEEVLVAATRMQGAITMVRAVQSAREGDIASARQVLEEAQRQARQQAQALDNRALRAQADQMVSLSEALPAVAPSSVAPSSVAPSAAIEPMAMASDEHFELEEARAEPAVTSGQPSSRQDRTRGAAVVRRAHSDSMSLLQTHR